MRNRLILLIIFLAFVHSTSWAQELNCSVKVLSPAIQGTDKNIFETLETSIKEFMNNTRWTNDNFKEEERIECNLTINVTKRNSVDEFEANIIVQSRRPVYKSSYFSNLINYQDNDFAFKYTPFQPFEFNENTYTNNLTSVLAFYAYIIIGLDYDSFSPEGGTPFYQKAQTIVNNAQNAPDKGWKAFEGSKNRYWIAENLSNPNFKALRMCMYNYHRMGLDLMTKDVELARKNIADALEGLMKVHNLQMGSFLMQLFFLAKADEIVNIFSVATPEVKNKLAPLLITIDPGNTSKFEKIRAN
ncbi:MAG: DUF4835 family protein [Bacteroidia bacterium]|nr:DUF4835 family protein [Bacteroidia bacterium]MCZ2248342.1 DUF4835 family protein [Bacteroidia bacterium]